MYRTRVVPCWSAGYLLLGVSTALIAGPMLLSPSGAAQSSTITDAASAETEIPVPVLRRLNRTEYANSLRDLFGADFPFTDELPPDGQAGGFDNIAESLSVSPVLLEEYLKIARKVSNIALGLSGTAAVAEQFNVKDSQSEWVAGMPLGTRGGIRVQYYFPLTGRYEFRAHLDNRGIDGQHQFDELNPTEGARLFRLQLNVSAGPHVFIVTFPDEYAEPEGPVPTPGGYGGRAMGGPLDVRASAITPTVEFWLDGKRVNAFNIHVAATEVVELALAYQPGPPILESVEINGPIDDTARSRGPISKSLTSCRPSRHEDERPCAEKILESMCARAYRRPVTHSDLLPILDAYERKRKTSTFDEALAMGLQRILVSPSFLFRVEVDPPNAKPGQSYRVSEFELATRLSYFLWSSMPDERLLEDARRGLLDHPNTLESEAARMLADWRAGALVDNFAIQYLGLRDVETFHAAPALYATVFDDKLPRDALQETRLFMRDLMRENRSVLDIIGGDYTFLNERLAKLYGIDSVKGPAFRKVVWPAGANRSGVITQASVLMATSHPAQTSPILRGKWILLNLLDRPPPTPPPGVPPLNTQPASDGRVLTTREQIERHRISPVCVSCHSKMDPYGFSLENFDAIGRWRTEENGSQIDAAAQLPHGKPFSGSAGLKAELLGRPEEFVFALTSRLMMYALGRKLEPNDAAEVQRIVNRAQAANYRFKDIVIGIVNSAPFQMRQVSRLQDSQQVATVQGGKP